MFLLLFLCSCFLSSAHGFNPNAAAAAAPAGSSSKLRHPLPSLTPLSAEAVAAAVTPPTTASEVGQRNVGGSEQFVRFAEFLLEAQRDICRQAEISDRGSVGCTRDDGEKGGATFCYDSWKRDAPTKVRACVRARSSYQHTISFAHIVYALVRVTE